jgi:hypothetical protein
MYGSVVAAIQCLNGEQRIAPSLTQLRILGEKQVCESAWIVALNLGCVSV